MPLVPWEHDELQALVSDPQSRVFLLQKTVPVVLQPFHLQDLKSAVRDLLNAGVDSYNKSLEGILLSYKHLRVINKSAPVAAETSGIVLEVQADFIVFRPEIGNVLKGVVNKISKDHIGVLLYNRFNITCPRPNSESRSEKWLGNDVVMHQEVTFKLKDMNFSGALPYLKGKLIAKGAVIAPNFEEEGKKSKKKKKKINDEPASLLELSGLEDTQSSSATPQLKNRKHKLEEAVESMDIKAKKSKKEFKHIDVNKSFNETEKQSVAREPLVESTSPKKRKKNKMSIGSTDESDFIPRFSLDVSQLPEQLPPPNADSTHFDFAKTFSSLNNKSQKKKSKVNDPGLSLIREESSEGIKGLPVVNSHLDLTAKSQQTNEGKVKKKKEKKFKSDSEPAMVNLAQISSEQKETGSNYHEMSSSGKLIAQAEPSFNIPPDSSKKKKKDKRKELSSDLEDVSSKERKASQSDGDMRNVPDTPKKKKKQKVDEQQASISSPVKVREMLPPSESKKSRKGVSQDISSQSNPLGSGKKHNIPPPAQSISNPMDILSPSKSKKKINEVNQSPSPSEHPKKKKEKESHEILGTDVVASDDTIPPGQKTVRESPLKLKSPGSPQKRLSLSSVSFGKSPGIGYFAAGSSMVDLDLGTRKGARQTPLMFGSLEGKIVPPPESPMKSPPKKNIMKYENDSDSDTPSPKKMIISVRKESSDSDDSDDSAKRHSVAESLPQHGVSHSGKRAEESSDESEYEMAVQSKLLKSMGVMQSPLTKAKPTMRLDSSDSESDESVVMKVNNQSKSLPASSNHPSSNSKPKKPMLAAKAKTSPKAPLAVQKTQEPSKLKSPPSKGKAGSLSVGSAVVDSDGSDNDLSMIRNIAMTLEQELGPPKGRKSKMVKEDKKSMPKPGDRTNPNAKSTAPKKPAAAKKDSLKKPSKPDAPMKGQNSHSTANVEESDSDLDLSLIKSLGASLKEQVGSKRQYHSNKPDNPKEKPSKPAKQIPPMKEKEKRSHSVPNVEDSDTDMDLIKSLGTSLKQEVGSKRKYEINKPRKKESSSKLGKSVEAKKVSKVTDDSDSGPDDRNTTKGMEEMRQKRDANHSLQKKKPPSKETKKDKSLKGNNSKVTLEKATTSIRNENKKDKSKGKKKSAADEDISNIMQRLMREAKLNIGLS